MANLNSNFNAKKPGILNISTTDVPLSPGFPVNGTAVFVEDGNGVCNVSFCDRTYASISELKLFGTALEVYREEITSNLTDALSPVTDAINQLNNDVASNSSRVTASEDFIDSFQELSISNRLSALEADYVSKAGTTITGVITFSSSGSINMSNRPITNLADPTRPDDATKKSYVDNQIALLQAQITDLQSQIDSL